MALKCVSGKISLTTAEDFLLNCKTHGGERGRGEFQNKLSSFVTLSMSVLFLFVFLFVSKIDCLYLYLYLYLINCNWALSDHPLSALEHAFQPIEPMPPSNVSIVFLQFTLIDLDPVFYGTIHGRDTCSQYTQYGTIHRIHVSIVFLQFMLIDQEKHMCSTVNVFNRKW